MIKIYRSFYDYPTVVFEAKNASFYKKGLKILNYKHRLQSLPISLAQIKAGYTSKNLLNEIFQIIYFLFQAKKITKRL